MLKKTDISTFSLDILGQDKRTEFSGISPEGDAFRLLCIDVLVQDFYDQGNQFQISPHTEDSRQTPATITGIVIPQDSKPQTKENDKSNNNANKKTRQTPPFKYIIDCKKNADPPLAFKGLNQYKKKLEKALTQPDAEKGPHAAWFDPEIKGYIYCVSCTFTDAAEKESFQMEIKNMLTDLSQHKGLSHLQQAGESIILYSWDQISKIVEDTPFLYHLWIEREVILGLERLIRPISPDRPLMYGDYLYNTKLNYFSRDNYREKHPEAGDLTTEADIMETLLQWGIYEGCVLYGEGGIGKSRLMLELGYMAQKEGWIVYKITSQLSNLESLKEFLDPKGKYLLLFDHVEDSLFFEPGIVKLLKAMSPSVEVKVIGNCRKTYINSSDLMEADNFMKWNLSIKDKTLERRYKNYVVEHILEDLRSLFPEEKDFYELRPAFAVFLRYLNEKYSQKGEILDSQKEGSFRKWLQKRLRMTFEADSYKELAGRKERFYIFCILPSTWQLTAALYKEFEDVILPLKKDGWVEDDEHNNLKVIHDTIAEEILILRLQEHKKNLDTEIKNIFNFAIERNSIENCFKLFNRVSDFIFELIKNEPNGRWQLSSTFKNLFSDYITQHPDTCEGVKDLLVKTPLMDEKDVVSLLKEKTEFFKPVIRDLTFGLKLSFIMKHFYKNWNDYEPQTIDTLREFIVDLLDEWLAANTDFLEHRYISARLISAFMIFFGFEYSFGKDGELVGTFAVKWLERYPLEMDTSFVIQSWLDARGDKDTIVNYVVPWLRKFPLEMETSFVIQSWLDTGGDRDIIKIYVVPWLQKYPLEMESSFVIKSWLAAGGDHLLIEKFVAPWLEKFPLEFEARFVIKSWLASGGSKDIVWKYVPHWLATYPIETETSFVIQSWLDAGGDKDIIKDYVAEWLKKNIQEMETSFVIKSWLDAGGDKDIVSCYMGPWLSKYLLEFETSFVIQAWLSAGGDKDVIREFISPWLEKYSPELETSFVIKAWLDAGGNKENVRQYVSPWLEKYPLEMETSFVIKSWLDAGGEIDIVAPHLARWLEKYPLEMETHFVFKSWLDARGDREMVKKYVGPWLEKYPDMFKTSFVIQAWLDAGGEKEVVQEYVAPWLEKYTTSFETSFVMNAWLDAGGEAPIIEKYIAAWLQKYQHQRESGFVIQAWLTAGGNPDIIREHIALWLLKHPKEMESGFMIQSWLDKGGSPTTIEEHIAPWLENHPQEIESGFVIQAWLTAGGTRETIQKYLIDWLGHFPLNEERTSFVLKAWLNAGGEAEVVEQFVIQWLDKFRHSFEATYVIKAWIKNTNDTETVKKYAHDWILVFKDHPDADFVIKRFCRFKDISDDVLDAAIHWCQKYADESETLFTISYLTRYHMANKKLGAQWLADMLIKWIDRPSLPASDLINLESIMYNTTRDNAFCYSDLSIKLSIKWFLSPHSFLPLSLDNRHTFLQQWWYFLKYSKLLSEGHIDIEAQEFNVKKFLKWINRWAPGNKKKIKRNLDVLLKILPQHKHLWGMVDLP